MTSNFGLIADIGGTNARFALVPIVEDVKSLHEDQIFHIRSLDASKYAHIEDAVTDYLSDLPEGVTRPEHAIMAIACPTDRDEIRMTNNKWTFSVTAVRNNLGLKTLQFINDFNAVANAVPHLTETGVVKIGDGEAVPGMPCVVTGPGTGLGLGGIVYDSQGNSITIQGEGGHIHFAPIDETEQMILDFLKDKYSRVSVERLISGHGLENIYTALYFQTHKKQGFMKAADISRAAIDGTDSLCEKSLNCFCAVFGSFAGDAALMYGAKGGLYIGGGIIPRMIDFLKNSQFRVRFTEKARLAGFVTEIPTYVIVSDQPGLLGAAAVLNEKVHQLT